MRQPDAPKIYHIVQVDRLASIIADIVVPLASPDPKQWFDTEEQMNTWLAGYWAAHRQGRTTAQVTA